MNKGVCLLFTTVVLVFQLAVADFQYAWGSSSSLTTDGTTIYPEGSCVPIGNYYAVVHCDDSSITGTSFVSDCNSLTPISGTQVPVNTPTQEPGGYWIQVNCAPVALTPVATAIGLSVQFSTDCNSNKGTITATITSSSNASVTGQISFQDGNYSIGTANITNGVATLSYAFSTIGQHLITASYTGLTGVYAASTSAQTVNFTRASPVITTTTIQPIDGDSVEGQNVTFLHSIFSFPSNLSTSTFIASNFGLQQQGNRRVYACDSITVTQTSNPAIVRCIISSLPLGDHKYYGYFNGGGCVQSSVSGDPIKWKVWEVNSAYAQGRNGGGPN